MSDAQPTADSPGAPLRHIVFYGTLMDGLSLPGTPDLGELGATRVGRCRLHGALYDTGRGYPALTRAGDPAAGTVLGELWELVDPERALPDRDAYELAYPADESASEYLRLSVRCLEPAGTAAWVYVWNGSTADMKPVASGDWRIWAPR